MTEPARHALTRRVDDAHAMTAAEVLVRLGVDEEDGPARRRDPGSAGAHKNPFLWTALAVAVAFEAAALGIRPLRDILGLTVLPPPAWAAALTVAVVPLVLTQIVRIARDRPESAASATGAR